MRLSVVIPTKNEERLLPKLLASLRQQTFQDFEMIVADADSTDQTTAIAASFGARVISGGMPGPGRNRGAAAANDPEWLIFFDGDVFLQEKNFLDDCLQEIQERGLDVATCRVRADQGTRLDQAMHHAYNAYAIATERLLPHAPGFCLFVRREVHQAIEGFDEEVIFAEDHDYVRRAVKAGFRFGILRCQRIVTSVRRLEKEGRLNFAAKLVYSELHLLTRGPFKRALPFSYEFANFTPKKSRWRLRRQHEK